MVKQVWLSLNFLLLPSSLILVDRVARVAALLLFHSLTDWQGSQISLHRLSFWPTPLPLLNEVKNMRETRGNQHNKEKEGKDVLYCAIVHSSDISIPHVHNPIDVKCIDETVYLFFNLNLTIALMTSLRY